MVRFVHSMQQRRPRHYFLGGKNVVTFTPGWGGGRQSRKVWVEVCRRGLRRQLCKTKIAHFAIMFKTEDTTFWPQFVLFCIQDYVIFRTKIVEIEIIGFANVDRSSQVFTLFQRLPVQKDVLFKTLNSEIHMTCVGKNITYNLKRSILR